MKNNLIGLAVLMSMVSACGTLSKKSNLINVGDGKKEVTEIMGDADDIQTRSKDEAWQYCKTKWGTHDYRIVWFESGKVTGVTSYKYSIPGSCENGIKSINWENKPDHTIEVRNR